MHRFSRQIAKLALDRRPQTAFIRISLVFFAVVTAVVAVRASVEFTLLRAENRATARYLQVLQASESRRTAALAESRRMSEELDRREKQLDRRDEMWRIAVRIGTLAARRGNRLSVSESVEIAQAVQASSERHGVPSRLVLGVITTESSFNRYAVSNKGAVGLMQLMPSTARGLAPDVGIRLDRPGDLYLPAKNIELGTYYLSQLIESQGSIPRALTAYNMGPNRATGVRASFVGSVSRFSGIDL